MAIYKGDHKVADTIPEIDSSTAGKVLGNDGTRTSWVSGGSGSGNVDDVKVNGTSVVTNKVANIDLTGKEDVSNKTTVLNSSSTDTQYPSAKATFDMGQDIREVAEGKTKSFVVSYADNPAFNSQNFIIQISDSFIDIDGIEHTIDELKLGDNFYVIETDVPDRWNSGITNLIPAMIRQVVLHKQAHQHQLTQYRLYPQY